MAVTGKMDMDQAQVSTRYQVDAAGVLDAPASPDPHIVIHVGPSVEIACERGGRFHRGTSVHGDVDIIPAETPSRWILKTADRALIIRVPQSLVNQVTLESDIAFSKSQIVNRFQVRDPRIEHLGWALMAENGPRSDAGGVYRESVGRALAWTLLERHSTATRKSAGGTHGGLSGLQLRRVLSYIEGQLGDGLSLAQIACAAGLSVSHCQRAFRAAMGISIHGYIVRQRVERAAVLLAECRLSISEIALEVGFSHASHLSRHMKRLLGHTPRVLRRTVGS
jgi:AraC family transcriptional regulator